MPRISNKQKPEKRNIAGEGVGKKENAPQERNTAPRPVAGKPERTGGQKVENSINIAVLQKMTISELSSLGKKFEIKGISVKKKHELIFDILKSSSERNGLMFSEGVLEVLPDGFGFRSAVLSARLQRTKC